MPTIEEIEELINDALEENQSSEPDNTPVIRAAQTHNRGQDYQPQNYRPHHGHQNRLFQGQELYDPISRTHTQRTPERARHRDINTLYSGVHILRIKSHGISMANVRGDIIIERIVNYYDIAWGVAETRILYLHLGRQIPEELTTITPIEITLPFTRGHHKQYKFYRARYIARGTYELMENEEGKYGEIKDIRRQQYNASNS